MQHIIQFIWYHPVPEPKHIDFYGWQRNEIARNFWKKVKEYQSAVHVPIHIVFRQLASK